MVTGRECPTPDKAVYPDRIAAVTALASITQRVRSGAPDRAYRCPCGRWHLASAPKHPRAGGAE